jgi:hypothetical protein
MHAYRCLTESASVNTEDKEEYMCSRDLAYGTYAIQRF